MDGLLLAAAGATLLSATIYFLLRNWRWAVEFEATRSRRASEKVPHLVRKLLYGGSSPSPRYHAAKLAVITGIITIAAVAIWLEFVGSLVDIVTGANARPTMAHLPPGHPARPAGLPLMLVLWGVSWMIAGLAWWRRASVVHYIGKVMRDMGGFLGHRYGARPGHMVRAAFVPGTAVVAMVVIWQLALGLIFLALALR